MDFVTVGKVVSTHGIKGEIRIISDFPYKDRVFVVGNTIQIGNKDYVINSYRVHKDYDMVTLEGYTNINEVLDLLKKDVYCSKESLNLSDSEVLDEELLTYEVVTNDGQKGKVLEVFYASPNNKVIRVQLDREVLIPISSPMIEEINKEKKQVRIHLIEGM